MVLMAGNIIRQMKIQDGTNDDILARVNSLSELQVNDLALGTIQTNSLSVQNASLSQLNDIETAIERVEENQTDKSQYTNITDGTYDLNIESDGSIPVTIKRPLESNGAIPVNIQDQHSRALDLDFAHIDNTTILSADPSIGDLTITVTATTGFVNGAYIGIFSRGGLFSFFHQIGAPAGNVITLDRPVDFDFATGDAVIASSAEMNVDGSATTQIYQIGPVTGHEVDITRVMGYLQDGTVMDDAKFGGLTALTNGVVLRKNDGVGGYQNLWNVKTNGQIRLLCFDANYSDKAPAGSYGLNFRNTYAGPSKHGVTIRLTDGETLEVLIQDSLTGLESFKMMAQGHIVED